MRPVQSIWNGLFLGLLFVQIAPADPPPTLDQPPNTWVKRSPLPGGPVSPRLGYESSWGYDPQARLLIRWGGHNQGGGGEQNAETWTFDPVTTRWTLKQTNDAPPGVCCAQQNVFDQVRNRFLRFPAFSASHGWQWWREVYLKNSSVWSYDLAANTWRDLRPLPEPRLAPLRCASWDSDYEVVVVFGGEGSQEGTLVYDPYTNTWTNRHTPDGPPFRSGGNLAYDAGRRLHILFGSQFTDDPHTWAYDLQANRWRDLKPSPLPPTNRNDAVLAYDSQNRVIIAVIKVTQGKDDKATHRLETWAFDVGRNAWTKMHPPREPDASGNRARLLTYLPDRGVAVLETRTHPPQGPAEQQIWTYCYSRPLAEPNPPPLPPTEVRVTTGKDSAELTWKPGTSAAAGFVIYRAEGEQPWEAAYREVGRVGKERTSFHNKALKRGTVYHYAIRAIDAAGRTGPESSRVRTQPRLVEDAVVSAQSERAVALTWKPPEGEDIAGYNVERAVVEVWSDAQLHRLKKRTPPLAEPSVGALRRIGPFTRITTTLLKEPAFTDEVDLARVQTVDGKPLWERRLSAEHLDEQGKPYRHGVFAYRIRAVNALGVASGPSPYFLTIPSAPQSVFAREQGTVCELKWAQNPEKGLRGYRVYRLDGRFDAVPITRLIQEPASALQFTDGSAGKTARRYYVVAVDALGQEGLPSAPVWFDREWKQYYEPFVGPWHQ
jgi:hypothetical protein